MIKAKENMKKVVRIRKVGKFCQAYEDDAYVIHAVIVIMFLMEELDFLFHQLVKYKIN